MMSSIKHLVQAGFIAGLLAAGTAVAATPAPDKSAPAASSSAQPAPIDTSGPSQLIESSAKVLLTGIEKGRAEFRKDPTGLYALVEQNLLPNFDTPYAAQQVLGINWRNATQDQRKRFVDAFYKSLLYTYGDQMIDFSADRLRVLPTKVDPADTRATVRTFIKRSNGTELAVDYSMRKVNGAWKAWDVVIDNISYVLSYRQDYGAAVEQKGLETVIKELEARAANARAGKGAKGAKTDKPKAT
jgi:phospholipid transport system substrate-binding protein